MRFLGCLGYEVSHDLPLHCQPRLILNSILTYFNGSPYQSPELVWFVHNISEWLVCEYSHLMSLKIGAKLLRNTFQGQVYLLNLRVLGFCVNHCFAYVVDEPLLLIIYAAKHNGTYGTIKYY